MSRGSVALLTLPLLISLLAGCIGSGADDAEEPAPAFVWTPGVHPWPAGNEWPAELDGSFDLLPVEKVRVPSFDGTGLEGWILRPDVPAGVRVPVVLWSLPYVGQTQYWGDDPEGWENPSLGYAVPVRFLVEHGYAVAIFSVRGSGNSDGCLEMFGPREQRDQVELVEWLGTQAWSNGRVGMMGLSYHGTTPWEAAIFNPPHLKTIVVAGMISDFYNFYHTPQGAAYTISGVFQAEFNALASWSPPLLGLTNPTVTNVQHSTVDHVLEHPERFCPEVLEVLTEAAKGQVGDDRNSAFWAARRLIDNFPDVEAAVLLTHGFQDLHGSGHQQQENAVWDVLVKAPKRMLEGQWGHEFPNFNSVNDDWAMEDWNDRLLAWFDFWLKGIGEPPGLGVVDYQDSTGGWHGSTSWPPAEARNEVLYLAGDALAPTPGAGSQSFRSAARAETAYASTAAATVCNEAGLGLAYLTEPFETNATIAGNPFAYLTLESDLPGGIVTVSLVELSDAFSCGTLEVSGARLWAAGVADLRFHAGNYQGTAFPTATPIGVRLDIPNVAEVVEAGHRLAVVVDYGEPIYRNPATPLFPTLTVTEEGEGASHVVLPFVDGTLGGAAPMVDYPPRPFVPKV